MTTQQTPLGSPFGAAGRAGDAITDVDLTGKTAIVTSGYSGICLERGEQRGRERDRHQ